MGEGRGRGISSVKFGHRESGYITSMIVGRRNALQASYLEILEF